MKRYTYVMGRYSGFILEVSPVYAAAALAAAYLESTTILIYENNELVYTRYKRGQSDY